jgi:glutamate-5-semialdehyde dehydrogenase
MKIENKAVPFGKILIIYESRPDVTIEASVIAFKAGNKVLLKGGKEAGKTNTFLIKLWQEALSQNDMDKNFVRYLDYGREQTQDLIKNNIEGIDLIIPRGGEGLINFVTENAKIPVIVSGRGNNFLYVDKEADFEMAVKLILNGKQRISVCNALDKVLIHKDLPDLKASIVKLADNLIAKNIEVLGDKSVSLFSDKIKEIAGEAIFGEEFLAAKIFLSLVGSVDEAIEKINKYSGHHSASIVTKNKEIARKFQDEVDSAAVHHNSSVRLTDGGQFGFGAEIGTSTQKLHARGPIGVRQLVTNKWYIYGNGQIRE